MTGRSTERTISVLVADAPPVQPLAPPQKRAGRMLLGTTIAITLLVAAFGGRIDPMHWAEAGAALVTGILAVLSAFALSVPGASRRWLLAPLLPLLLWIGFSGASCYANLVRLGAAGWGWGSHGYCLFFLLGAGTIVGLPLLWMLSRARPIDPLPVALLGGVGAAAIAAFLLHFFHPFPITVIDLGLHLLAALLIVGLAGLLRRPALRPA